jgi:ribonuclease G
VVQELHIERTSRAASSATSTSAASVRVLPGMQSAFIEVGLERTAFLHVADIWQPRQTATERADRAHPAEGQSVMVQVLKDPIGTKGARLSTQISHRRPPAGLPAAGPHIGISQRIEDEAEREACAKKSTRAGAGGRAGRLHRAHHGRNASDEELATDIAYLRKLWAEIRDKAREDRARRLLLHRT